MYKMFVDANGNKSYSRVIDGEGISFIESPGNRDWEEFEKWIEEGNTPELVEHLTEIPTPPAE